MASTATILEHITYYLLHLSFWIICERENYLQVENEGKKIGTPRFPTSFKFLFNTRFVFIFFFF